MCLRQKTEGSVAIVTYKAFIFGEEDSNTSIDFTDGERDQHIDSRENQRLFSAAWCALFAFMSRVEMKPILNWTRVALI